MRKQHTTRRAGFSLMELLVVLAIIAVLIALSSAAVLKTRDWQHRSNSRTLVEKTHGETSKQWTATIDTARRESPPQSVLNLAGGDAKRAQVIWVKFRLKQEFPMSYREALNPSGGLIPAADLPSKYAAELNGRTAANNPATESSACLLLALKKKRRGAGFNAEEALGASGMKDTDGDGVPEIIDSWGIPVAFYRWGTEHDGLNVAGGTSSGALDRDKEDPDHLLMNATWQANNAASVGIYEAMCHPLRSGGNPRSRYTEPTIVSAGSDRKFGLNGFNMTVAIPSEEADNIYSFNLR